MALCVAIISVACLREPLRCNHWHLPLWGQDLTERGGAALSVKKPRPMLAPLRGLPVLERRDSVVVPVTIGEKPGALVAQGCHRDSIRLHAPKSLVWGCVSAQGCFARFREPEVPQRRFLPGRALHLDLQSDFHDFTGALAPWITCRAWALQ